MTSGKPLALAFGIGLLTLFGSLSAAHAQPYYGAPPPVRGVYRSGIVFGGSLGGGAISATCAGPTAAGRACCEGHLGGMINPRLALMGDLWGLVHPWDDGSTRARPITASTPSRRSTGWPTSCGSRAASASDSMQLQYDGDAAAFGDESGFAAMGAAGVEVVQSYNFTVDIQGRLGHGFYTQGGDVNNFGIMVGVNWY